MKAAYIQKPGEVQIMDVETPNIGNDEILIKVAYAGICGTDIHIFNGEYEAVYPIIAGHEFSGTVTQIGSDVKYVKPGDRVTADPNIPCHRCLACKRGHFNQCENLEAIGVTKNGAFAEFVTVPEQVVFPIGHLPFHQAAMVEPLACVIWGLKRIQAQPGDSALVFGAGPMGCLLSQALKNCGIATIVITDKISWRLDIAKELGVSETILASSKEDLDGQLNTRLFQVIVDATGVSQVLQDAFTYVQPRGKIWIFGVVPPGETIRFSPYEVFRKDISIIGSFAVNQTFYEAINLITTRRIQVDPLISHQIPLENFSEAIFLAQNDPHRMKVQIHVG